MQLRFWIVFVLYLSTSNCQNLPSRLNNNSLLQKQWNAQWICVPGAPALDYGIYYFRKKISITERPGTFIIHVSGDNCYTMFVNEKMVSHGPARNDLNHWNFETVDLALFLLKGNNVITTVVWNEGTYRPEGQISRCTGFLVQGDTEKEWIVNTIKAGNV